LQLAVDDIPSLGNILVALLLPEPLSNLAAGARTTCIAQAGVHPIAVGAFPFTLDDLDFVARLQLVIQTNELAVDARATAKMAQIGVDLVCEVNRRRTRRQVDDLPCGRVDVDALFYFTDIEHPFYALFVFLQ